MYLSPLQQTRVWRELKGTGDSDSQVSTPLQHKLWKDLPQVFECLWVPDISPATEIFAAVLDPEARLVYFGLGD